MNISNDYSVIILTHAPKDDLIMTLKMLLRQSILPKKILLYNTNESIFYDKISEKKILKNLIFENRNIIQIYNILEQSFDHGKSRNDAMRMIETDFALFLTDDAVPYDDKLCENLIETFKANKTDSEKVAAIYARQIAKTNSRLSEKYVREFNYPDYDIIKNKNTEDKLGIKNYFFSNVCAMYDRSIFEILGGFEENIILNEDTFYSYKAINEGYRIIYSSKSLVLHSHNYTFKEQFNRNFDIGVSQSEKKEIFDKIPLTKEGYRLTRYVTIKLLKGFHFIEIMRFIIECAYRYMGYKKGYNYKNLSLDCCIAYSSNKEYFKKKNNDKI